MSLSKKELQNLIGENLRRARHSRRITINDLSRLMEITPGYLGLIEHGKRGLTPHKMLLASELLDIPISAFFSERY